KIMTQKWLSLLLVGHEAWFNVRRTGLPVLPIPKDNLNNDRFPRRYRYPETEQAANHEQYQQAVARLGEDAYHIGGWWDG
ncbi:MAG: SusD/RagB family nutrient-binding outer membrane lipoprotein, partial [Bacteroidetes bacterium]